MALAHGVRPAKLVANNFSHVVTPVMSESQHLATTRSVSSETSDLFGQASGTREVESFVRERENVLGRNTKTIIGIPHGQEARTFGEE